ncbi:tetratricopeptide repeat protein [Leptothoe spongobia]|uniref:protein O-GlcNAc transferase n=1 Tax=Leptothoe spongobia TAU-MAC 1115 TaxID=1967444 RepID=A0A947DDC4_9CYAN|nr:tetratricopeptide repeat protein [Leptothoe spongobia]MBT9314449.1 tetratricopeptide repeat protein [Leptothoe spongobia TAU-MAC 1115]
MSQLQTVQQLQQKTDLARKSNCPRDVEQLYREILQIRPDHPDYIAALSTLGNLLVNQQRWDDAVELYRKALTHELVPDTRANVLTSLGIAFMKQYQLIEATDAFQEAVGLNPKSAWAYTNLGLALKQRGRFTEAELACRQALTLNPDNAVIYNCLGTILRNRSKHDEAADVYRRAIELRPDLIEAYINLGYTLERQAKYGEATRVYEKVLEIDPDCVQAKFSRIFCQLPIIYQNSQEIVENRRNYQQCLEQFIQDYNDASVEELADAAAIVGISQPYLLPYQGFNDRQLQQDFGQFMSRLMAARYPQWSQPISLPEIRPQEKIRVGIVSGFFREHSVWKIPLKGWVENLDAGEFELFGYHTGCRQDPETLVARKSFKKFVQGPLDIKQWCQRIIDDKLHLLIFSEFGMDPTTLELGSLRLAPIQLAAAGHPETSGLPTIDYFLSCELMEPENAEEHYTETLVRLPNLSIYYTPLEYYPHPVSRQEINLTDDDVMFWCCQSLFKYLPKHDDVFPKIASQLDKARFVFIEHGTQHVTDIFKGRLRDAFSQFQLDYQEFCRFVPRMNPRKFAGTASLADIFLDSIGWSGHNSALESLVFDLPIVTLPEEFMRGRHSYAILKMMDVEATIASSKEDYVEIAARLGKDPQYRKTISLQIAQNKHRLYRDLQSVRGLEDFLLKLVNKSKKLSASGNSSEIETALDRAEKLQALGKTTEAQTIYQQVIARQPDQPRALVGLATLAQKNGQLQIAEDLFNRAIKVQPDLFSAWFSLGNLWQGQGRLDDAIKAYQRVLELRADLVPVYNNLAYVLQQNGQLDESIKYYRQALSLEPNSREIDVHHANALHLNGELPDDKWIHYAKLNYKLGIVQKKAENLKSAIDYFQQAIVLDPNLAEAHLGLGIAKRNEQGQLEEALVCFEKAIKLKPDQEGSALESTAYMEMGRTYQIQKRIDEAVQAFHQAVSLINPGYLAQYCSEKAEVSHPNFEDFAPPTITFEPVEIGGHQFPAIPPVPPDTGKRPFWSVAIPAVNRPEYFPECLASVLAQWNGHDDMEIVVLDNGSDPPLFDIVNALGQGIIRYYRLPKTIPLQPNWNTLVSLCRGQWIHLLQHDDYVLPGFYSRLKTSLETCPDSVGAAFTGYENINENRKVIFRQEHNLKHFRGVVKDWIKRLGVSCSLGPPSMVIRRDAYEKLGGYCLDFLYACDWEFYKRVASFYDWWYEPGILTHYRQHSNSMTRSLIIEDKEDGSPGAGHQRAIEISEGYLPADWRDEITKNSRRFHNKWCLDRAMIPVDVGRLDSAFYLIQDALRIDSSPAGINQVFNWLSSDRVAPLKAYIAERLMDDQ